MGGHRSSRYPMHQHYLTSFVGGVRRELLDHVVVLGEDHLRRLLREYVEYYNAERVRGSNGDATAGRTNEIIPSLGVSVVPSPRVGCLPPRYGLGGRKKE